MFVSQVMLREQRQVLDEGKELSLRHCFENELIVGTEVEKFS